MSDSEPRAGVEELLSRIRAGEAAARNELISLVYAELRRIASRKMRRESPDNSLNTTALVHEAYVRLFANRTPDVHSHDEFLRAMSGAMRRILVEHGRKRRRSGRLLDDTREPLDQLACAYEKSAIDLLAWNQAFEELQRDDPRMAEAVELRYFLRVHEADIARIVQIPLRRLQRYWEPTLRRLRKHIA